MIGQILIDVVRKNRLKFVYSIFKRRYFNLILVTLILIILLPRLIEPETLTITTYYPAPYGGYVSILTTGNTWLARDVGNVGIGTSQALSKLSVNGTVSIGKDYVTELTPANSLVVQGDVGVGTPDPKNDPPNHISVGNIDANDIWLRSSNRWLSQGPKITGGYWVRAGLADCSNGCGKAIELGHHDFCFLVGYIVGGSMII